MWSASLSSLILYSVCILAAQGSDKMRRGMFSCALMLLARLFHPYGQQNMMLFIFATVQADKTPKMHIDNPKAGVRGWVLLPLLATLLI